MTKFCTFPEIPHELKTHTNLRTPAERRATPSPRLPRHALPLGFHVRGVALGAALLERDDPLVLTPLV